MLLVVLVIAMLNLLLGFMLTIGLERKRVIYVPDLCRHPRPSAADSKAAEEVDCDQFVTPDENLIEQIPADWMKLLNDANLQVNSFVESTVQVVKLEVGRYRDGLLILEETVRSCLDTKQPDQLRKVIKELTQLNEDWSQKVGTVAKALSDQHGNMGQYTQTGNQLESLLLTQMPAIEQCCARIEAVDVDRQAPAAVTVCDSIAILISMAHDLRDAMHDNMITIMQNENRLDDFDRKQHFDAATQLHNRLGIEIAFQNWWCEDPERTRSVTIAMADIDGFSEVNRRIGTRAGDRVLGTIGRYLDNLVSQTSGLNRVSRFAGQRFLFFLSDVHPKSCIDQIEEIRQSFAAATFLASEEDLCLTLSNGVTEVRLDETTSSLFQRLDGLLATAKKAGKNQSVLDDGNGPESVASEPREIVPRRIAVNVQAGSD